MNLLKNETFQNHLISTAIMSAILVAVFSFIYLLVVFGFDFVMALVLGVIGFGFYMSIYTAVRDGRNKRKANEVV